MGSLGAMHGQTCNGRCHQFGSSGQQQLRRPTAALRRQQRQAQLVKAEAVLAKAAVPASHREASKAALEQLRSASVDGNNREYLILSMYNMLL